uniref:Uncharacterized protein n=1 Tax=Ditylum brightwellii TaxID=49249 RepID=A0A7S4RJE3_9STRA|mmetsp:Transcript_25138/g.37582  ORF Transcript_25138/g.37582 Transcript_25138/m.37582 type:complete len:207 (+) Transcript_25138:203-823(+)
MNPADGSAEQINQREEERDDCHVLKKTHSSISTSPTEEDCAITVLTHLENVTELSRSLIPVEILQKNDKAKLKKNFSKKLGRKNVKKMTWEIDAREGDNKTNKTGSIAKKFFPKRKKQANEIYLDPTVPSGIFKPPIDVDLSTNYLIALENLQRQSPNSSNDSIASSLARMDIWINKSPAWDLDSGSENGGSISDISETLLMAGEF